jgi:hypothetical protein
MLKNMALQNVPTFLTSGDGHNYYVEPELNVQQMDLQLYPLYLLDNIAALDRQEQNPNQDQT